MQTGSTIIAYSPLESGLLSARFHREPDSLKRVPIYRRWSLTSKINDSRRLIQTLEKMAVEYGATPGQIALNWLINYHPDTVVAIPGASTPEQARQNAAAMGFRLSERDMVYLDETTCRFR